MFSIELSPPVRHPPYGKSAMLIRAKPCIVSKVSDIQTDYVPSDCGECTVGY